MADHFHSELLTIIQANEGVPTKHTFSDNYLGTTHPRYSINVPTLRLIAKEWMRDHRSLSAPRFQKLLTSLVKGKSATEKMLVGMLLDASRKEQREFDPACFDTWLDYLEGWAEIDTVCTGQYAISEIPPNISIWKKLLTGFSKSKNIHKRRASLVFLCSPISQNENKPLAALAFALIDRLKSEKEILITKAISWLLRSMVKHHHALVTDYVDANQQQLPSIAVRETLVKLRTGRKTAR